MIGRPARARFEPILHTFIVVFGLAAIPVSNAAITLLQADGKTLSLPAPAESIVTLAPNLAELVFAAGAGEHLKAVVDYSNFPAEVARIPRVGDAFRVDLERIMELKPDLVIAWKSGNPQSALQKLQQLGIKVWQIEITWPGEIADAVENIARAAGTESEGGAAAMNLRNRLADLQKQNAGKSRLDYFYQISPRPLYTINGQHIISRSLAICGGHNVFSDLQALAPPISPEAVIIANPQVMIAPEIPDEPPALLGWQEWPRLQAIQTGALFYLPADEINQATPRLLNSIESACKRLDEVRIKLAAEAHS